MSSAEKRCPHDGLLLGELQRLAEGLLSRGEREAAGVVLRAKTELRNAWDRACEGSGGIMKDAVQAELDRG